MGWRLTTAAAAGGLAVPPRTAVGIPPWPPPPAGPARSSRGEGEGGAACNPRCLPLPLPRHPNRTQLRLSGGQAAPTHCGVPMCV